ncbi:MAG: hypothetical protein L3J24_10850 [Xanthomonadales bacterium]|nr:hypothetical protein [Xanthomonadales bacterium]
MYKLVFAVIATIFGVSLQVQAAPVCTNHELDWSLHPNLNSDINTTYPFTAIAIDIDGTTLDLSVLNERAARDNRRVANTNTTFPGIVDQYMNSPQVYRYWRQNDDTIDTLTYDFSEDVALNLFMLGGHRPSAGNFAYAEITFWDGPNGTGNKVVSQHASGPGSAVLLGALGDPTTVAINVLPLGANATPSYPSTFLSTDNSYTMVTYDPGFPLRPWTVLDLAGAVVRSMTWTIYGSNVDVSPQLAGSGSNGDESRDVSVSRANTLAMNISAYIGSFNFDICENNEDLSLGDYVWYDSDQDGIQDLGEPGINGLTVNLYPNGSCTGAPSSTTTTAANNGNDGFYQFSPLSTGDYCVEFIAPTGYMISPPGQGSATTDSNANPTTGRVANIDLHAVDQTIDAGMFVPGSVSGLVWCESSTNPNTVYNAVDADTLQSNIGVTLYEDTNCNSTLDGAEAATAVIQATVAGNYSFTDLITGGPGVGNNPPGCYLVEVDTDDPDLGVCNQAITPSIQAPVIDAVTPNSTDNNFGNNEQLSLGDYVWYDTDQDGTQDAGEIGINGVTVNLYPNGSCTGAPSSTTTTVNNGNDGFYQFSPLAAGDYCVEFSDLPAGWIYTLQAQGADDTSDSDVDPVTAQINNINLQNNDPDEDAGIYAALGTASGIIFCDSNPVNGSLDAGELLPGITINLHRDIGCDGTADALYESQDTDSNGEYLFSNLPVAFSPTPPNPAVCYIVNYDTNDSDFNGCVTPILPEEESIELTTNDPDAPPTTFGTTLNMQSEPVKVPTINNWGILLLITLLFGYVWRREKIA